MAKIDSTWLKKNNFLPKNGDFELYLDPIPPATFTRKLKAIQDTGTQNFGMQYLISYVFDNLPASTILSETNEVEDLFYLLTNTRLLTDNRP